MTRKKRPSDINLIAKQIVEDSTQDKPTEEYPPKKLIKEKNPAAVALGRLGGLKGGKARADKLSAQVRHEIAVKAAKKRWGKKAGD
jgi:hypothetical protein